MKIYRKLKIDIKKKQVISFVGGGGKTTSIFQLAGEFVKENKKVLISTTMKIFNPKKEEYDYYFLEDMDLDFSPDSGSITILGEDIKDGKLIGVKPEKLDEIAGRNIFDIILIEADGSKGKPIKAPGSHEPLIPRSTTKTIGVIGLDSLGGKISEDLVHRAELFLAIPGNENLKTIDEQGIVNLVGDKNGLFKDSKGEKILLLNKAKESRRISIGKNIKKRLKAEGFTGVVLGDVREKKFY